MHTMKFRTEAEADSFLKFSEEAIKSRMISARKVNCGSFHMIELWDLEVLK